MSENKPSVFVAGAAGMVGSAICRRLGALGYPLLRESGPRTDLRDQEATRKLIEDMKPGWVFIAAAKVGGIHANSAYPAEFIYDNLMIQTNLIHASHIYGVKKLLFLGSSCIYPKMAPQPLKEEYLLSDYLEPTNEAYAVAKIAGIMTAKSYATQYNMNCVSVMPTNIYGPGDNFHLENAHVIPAIMRKMHEAKKNSAPQVRLWGTGDPLREFLHVDDLASACVFLMENYDSWEIVNIGSGREFTIRKLAELVRDVVGYEGELYFDSSMPDGTPRKLLDVTKLTGLGWRPSIMLEAGLKETYRWFLENEERLRK